MNSQTQELNEQDQAADSQGSTSGGLLSGLALLQAIFYVVTGIWPLLSIHTFEQVTGPKTDRWLVKTVGVLVTIVGAVLAMAGWRRKISDEVGVLAVGSALGLTAIDFTYVAKKRISRVYLLDALAEIILVAMWAVFWLRGRRSNNA